MNLIKITTSGTNNRGNYTREYIVVGLVARNGYIVYRAAFRTIYADQSMQQRMVESGRAGWSSIEFFQLPDGIVENYQGELPKREEFNYQSWDFGWQKDVFKA